MRRIWFQRAFLNSAAEIGAPVCELWNVEMEFSTDTSVAFHVAGRKRNRPVRHMANGSFCTRTQNGTGQQ